MLFQHLAVALLAIGVSASDVVVVKREIPATHVVHERQMEHWARSWVKKRKVADSALLPMRIGLKQSNLDHGRELLMEISNPKSDKYGKHLSVEEVTDLFSPPELSVSTVKTWLVSAGIPSDRIVQSTNKAWIAFDATTSQVEDLLYTEFHVYEHTATGTENIAAEEYYVPSFVKEHIDYITPGIRLRVDPGEVKKLKRRSIAEGLRKRGISAMNTGAVPIEDVKGNARLPTLPTLTRANCDKYVTNQCVRNQYRVPKNTLAAPGNELGIFESLNDHYNREDLDVFYTYVQPEIPNGTYPIDKLIDGAIGASQSIPDAGVESDLDFEASIPMIYPQKTVLFQTDDQYYEVNETGTTPTPYIGFWNTFFDALDGSYCTYSAYGETGNCDKPECLDPSYPDPNPGGYKGQLMCGTYKPTNVISISYGGGEADLPGYYLKRQCDEIMKLGLQGITVVISSGDDGVGSFPGDGGPNGCAGPTGRIFYPASDASCPYVLAVGSTQFLNGTAAQPKCKMNEIATTSFPSGGGFSNVFDAPDYQKAAVKQYFDTTPLSFNGYTDPGTNFSSVGDGVYKIGGRGYPDVAAIGDRFVIRTEGIWATVGGTSLAAPIWASLLTLVNEQRIAAGKGTIGFINPVLYAHPEIFNDITVGSNPNCNSTGFLAAKGWDPVTGLGSPKYPKLLELLLGLP